MNVCIWPLNDTCIVWNDTQGPSLNELSGVPYLLFYRLREMKDSKDATEMKTLKIKTLQCQNISQNIATVDLNVY